MSESGQGRPDAFASTLTVQRSAVGSGSGRHETAPPMSQLGRLQSFPTTEVEWLGRSFARTRATGEVVPRAIVRDARPNDALVLRPRQHEPAARRPALRATIS